jgi:hypothetical protein
MDVHRKRQASLRYHTCCRNIRDLFAIQSLAHSFTRTLHVDKDVEVREMKAAFVYYEIFRISFLRRLFFAGNRLLLIVV